MQYNNSNSYNSSSITNYTNFQQYFLLKIDNKIFTIYAIFIYFLVVPHFYYSVIKKKTK